MKKRLFSAAAVSALILIWTALPAIGSDAEVILKGKVHYLDKPGLSLAEKMSAAHQDFGKSGQGDAYFMGYAFLSRHEIHQGGHGDESRPYILTVSGDRIKRKRAYEWEGGESYTDKDGNEVVGLVLLYKVSE